MKAKLAWLCYDEEAEMTPDFLTEPPDRYLYREVIPIVYFEVEEES